MLIHINDKAALEKYSELDFNTNKKTRYWDGYEKNRHAMGVRLIKPDGRTIDIDTSEFIEVEEGKKGEKKSRKLAIPGLEAGDDIDIFYYTESKLQNVHPDPIIFTLRDDAPIMNYTIHCVVDDNLSTQYRTLNGAPDFNVTRDEDKNYVLDLELRDIEREPRLWYNPARQSPMVKLYIYNRRNSDDFTPKSARKDGLQPNPDALTILEDRWDAWTWWIEAYPVGGTMAQDYIRDGKKLGKAIKEMAKKGEITPQQAADYLYNLQCYIYVAMRGKLDDVTFIRQFNHDLRILGIPTTVGVSTTGDNEPLDMLANLNNTKAFNMVDGDTPRYYFPRCVAYWHLRNSPPICRAKRPICGARPRNARKNLRPMPISSLSPSVRLLTTAISRPSTRHLTVHRLESIVRSHILVPPSGMATVC